MKEPLEVVYEYLWEEFLSQPNSEDNLELMEAITAMQKAIKLNSKRRYEIRRRIALAVDIALPIYTLCNIISLVHTKTISRYTGLLIFITYVIALIVVYTKRRPL